MVEDNALKKKEQTKQNIALGLGGTAGIGATGGLIAYGLNRPERNDTEKSPPVVPQIIEPPDPTLTVKSNNDPISFLRQHTDVIQNEPSIKNNTNFSNVSNIIKDMQKDPTTTTKEYNDTVDILRQQLSSGPVTFSDISNQENVIVNPDINSWLERAMDPELSVFPKSEKTDIITNLISKAHEGYEALTMNKTIEGIKNNPNLSEAERANALNKVASETFGVLRNDPSIGSFKVGQHHSSEVLAREAALMNELLRKYPNNLDVHGAVDPFYNQRMITGEYDIIGKQANMSPADITYDNLPDVIKALKEYNISNPSEKKVGSNYRDIMGADAKNFNVEDYNAASPDNSIEGFAKDFINNTEVGQHAAKFAENPTIIGAGKQLYNYFNQESTIIKERYLEENFLKKIDRAFHADEYKQLMDQLNYHRADQRQMNEELANLHNQYQGVKNSPQGQEIKNEISSVQQRLDNNQENLDMYKDIGRKGLTTTPQQYRENKAGDRGMKIGGLAGLTAGGLGGLTAGQAMFGESDEMTESIENKKEIEMSTTFKDRLLEEGVNGAWDKTKEFARSNPGLAAGVGGAGLGALMNYAGGGAEDLAAERTQDVMDFRKDDVGDFMTGKNTLPYKEFSNYRDQILNLKGDQNFINSEDAWSFTGDNKMASNLEHMVKDNPEMFGKGISDPENFQILKDKTVGGGNYIDLAELDKAQHIGGHKVNSGLGHNEAYDVHKTRAADKFKNMSVGDTNKNIAANPELMNQQKELMQKVGDAQSDSYRNKMLTGAALGAGGTYAARKLKDKQGR